MGDYGKEIKAVIGKNFGDEGKGKCVDLLCAEAVSYTHLKLFREQVIYRWFKNSMKKKNKKSPKK